MKSVSNRSDIIRTFISSESHNQQIIPSFSLSARPCLSYTASLPQDQPPSLASTPRSSHSPNSLKQASYILVNFSSRRFHRLLLIPIHHVLTSLSGLQLLDLLLQPLFLDEERLLRTLEVGDFFVGRGGVKFGGLLHRGSHYHQ